MKKQLTVVTLAAVILLNTPVVHANETVVIGDTTAPSTVQPVDAKPEAVEPGIVIGGDTDPSTDKPKKDDDKAVVKPIEPSSDIKEKNEEKEDSPDTKSEVKPVVETKPSSEIKPAPEALKPVTIPVVTAPITTDKGQTVVGTNNGNVLVKDVSGHIKETSASEVGGTKQSDGTIVLKTSDGKLQVLPHTGDDGSIWKTLLGICILLGAIAISFREQLKKWFHSITTSKKHS